MYRRLGVERLRQGMTLVKANLASKELGVSVAVLRRWDQKGKIRTIRSPGGMRLYDVEAFKRRRVDPGLIETRFRNGDLSLIGEIVSRYDDVHGTTTRVLLNTFNPGESQRAVEK